MKKLLLTTAILFTLCFSCQAFDVNGVVTSHEALLRVADRIQLAIMKRPGTYNVVLSCQIADRMFKYAAAIGERSPDEAAEVARLSFRSCPGTCIGKVSQASH